MAIKYYYVRPFSLNLSSLERIISRVCQQMTKPNQKDSAPKHIIAPSPVANYLLIGAGSMFTATVIAGFIVGYMLDYLFGTMPIFFLACGVLGFIGGAQKVRLLTRRLDQQATQKIKDESNVE